MIVRLFAGAQRPQRSPAIRTFDMESMDERTEVMSDAQIGLLTATPLIILFAAALRAMGVLSTTATASAVGLSVAIAIVLFTTQ